MTDRAPSAAHPDGAHAVIAASSVTDDRARVLKHGDTFAVFDHYGDMKTGGLDEEGLYHEGTRFLSRFELRLDGKRPFFLSSTVRDETQHLVVALTNPDVLVGGRIVEPLGTLQLSVRKFLWDRTCHQSVLVKNYGVTHAEGALSFHFAADYADIFEVRGMSRPRRGVDLPAEIARDAVVLGYRGLDDVVRKTAIRFRPAPSELAGDAATHRFRLGPGESFEVEIAIGCTREGAFGESGLAIETARSAAAVERARQRARAATIATTNERVDDWISRAASDVTMMTTELATGPYPYAGVPWFNTPFGRDGIVTALECLWVQPQLAAGVLSYLASTQATAVVPEEDAEPGKILHETRKGEMAALKEMPFGRYYGSVDATPLFVVLAGAYYARTGDRALIERIWPNIEAALAWIDTYGDRDGDGFVEYDRQADGGLLHQAWKDSDDAVFHADGSVAHGPLALCEVQAFAYAARRAGARLASMLGNGDRAKRLDARADTLRERFENAFWSDALGTYALALDGDKRPCLVRTTNPGQCLFTGIVRPDRARLVGASLLGPACFSGWGLRTVYEGEARYNPMSYHNGSVWPQDTALAAWGLARYGMGDLALRVWDGMFAAGTSFDLHRMPELFCGFTRSTAEGPIPYPVACAPQAWSAASVFMLLQACLGIDVTGPDATVSLTDPRLPAAIDRLTIENLVVGRGTVDLLLVRHGEDVGVNVTRRVGEVRTIVVKA